MVQLRNPLRQFFALVNEGRFNCKMQRWSILRTVCLIEVTDSLCTVYGISLKEYPFAGEFGEGRNSLFEHLESDCLTPDQS